MLFDGIQPSSFIKVLFVLSIFSALINYLVNSFCLAFGEMRIYLITFGISSLINLSIISVGIFYYNFDIYNCLTITVFIELISAICSFIFLSNIKELKGYEATKGFRDVINYASQSYLGVSGSTLISNGDTIVLANILTQESLGIYSIAKTVYRLFSIIPQTINSVIFGILCDLNAKNASVLVNKTCLTLTLLFTSIFIAGVFSLDKLIVFVWGIEFSTAYEPALILLIAATFISATSPMNPYFLTQNKPMISSQITLISGTLGLVGAIMLAPHFGIIGAATSVLIAGMTTCVLRIFNYRKLTKVV